MKISIITITLNNYSGLKKTLESVISQQCSNLEFIVIDGASTDNSIDLLRKYDDVIDYWVSEQDRGIYHAMNKGIERATGDYFLFLNSGDWFVEGVLDDADSWEWNKDLICFNSYHYFSEKYFSQQRPPDNLSPRHLFSRTVTHQSVFFRRDLFNRYGMYDESYRICGDFDFLLKIVIDGASSKRIDRFLVYFDRHGISSVNPVPVQEERRRAVQKNFNNAFLLDYEYYKKREEELEVLLWYKQQEKLYKVLLTGYNLLNTVYRFVEKIKKIK